MPTCILIIVMNIVGIILHIDGDKTWCLNNGLLASYNNLMSIT